MDFKNQKSQRLKHVDLSRKGSIDEPILELVDYINSLPAYFTTSSCSGRIIVFEPTSQAGSEDNDQSSSDIGKDEKSAHGKKGCKWLFVSHNKMTPSQLGESLENVHQSDGSAVFKFEAMVMHVQCQTLEDAQRLHLAAMSSGFRNSGISVSGKKKIVVGIRSTHSLEAPISRDGTVLISSQYYSYLMECANLKMEENFSRIQRFFENVKQQTSQIVAEKTKKDKRKERNENKKSRTDGIQIPNIVEDGMGAGFENNNEIDNSND